MTRDNQRAPVMIVLAGLMLSAAGPAGAVIQGFVDNETANSIDWADAVDGMGAAIDSNVDFDAHPQGILQDDFYETSDGVTLSATASIDIVTFGAGPGQSNTSFPPVSPGEGPHAASNFLRGEAQLGSLIISFDQPVLGVGLFVIDLFSPGS